MDSILAVEIVNRVNRSLGISLRATDLFNYPSVEKLMDRISTISMHTPVVSDVLASAEENTSNNDEDVMNMFYKLSRGECSATEVEAYLNGTVA